jgi:hypothetical protein
LICSIKARVLGRINMKLKLLPIFTPDGAGIMDHLQSFIGWGAVASNTPPSHAGGAPSIATRGDRLPECRRRYQREGCESGDPGVMQISSSCIDFGLGFGARYAKYAMYFKGRDEF